MDFEKKLEAYYELEGDTRRDLHDNVISEDIYLADEDCYGLRDFLFSLDNSSPLKCGEIIRDYGDEEGNHNQMDYMRDHLMPYLERDFSKHAGFFKSMTKLVKLAAARTSYWGDFDEEYPQTTEHLYNPTYDEETTALCNEMESYSKEWEEICKDVKEYIETLVTKRIDKTHETHKKRERTVSPSPQSQPSDVRPEKKKKTNGEGAKYTIEKVKKAVYANNFEEYRKMKKVILKNLEARCQVITDLELVYVVDEFDVGPHDFLEICDTYVKAVEQQNCSDEEDLERDWEEIEKDFEDAEMTFDECTVPEQVWAALF